jgi:phenylacetate-CoA ligase
MWLYSTFRGIRTIQARAGWDRAQVLAYQQASLARLLSHLWGNSPFYRDYYSAHGIREADLGEITVRDLPIINKDILMENFDRVSQDPVLRRAPIEAWIHSGSEQIYRKRFLILHTSGTSGTLGIFVYDKAAWSRMRGVTTRVGTVRINPFNRVRLAWYGATHGRFAGVTSCRTLPRLLCDVRLCSVLEPLPQTIETLNRFQPEQLFGYAASIKELATAALEGKLQIRPDFVTTSGEVLTDEAISVIERAWGVTPSNAYGTSESLCLGIRAPGQSVVTLMEDENIIEILDENDLQVAPGAVGRTVITALYNYAIPVVRYDLRDYVTRGHRAERAPFDHILRVEGRVNDALPVTLRTGSADTIHPVVLSEFFVPGIRRFQFVAESPARVRLKYMGEDGIDTSVRGEFERILGMKGALGATELVVERVGELPVDPLTGKHRLVVLAR